MLKATATITQEDGRIMVTISWSGAELDRPSTGGISCGKDMRLANRLAACINAQKAHSSPRVVRDINGRTYVQATCLILGRRMNADLKRLGF